MDRFLVISSDGHAGPHAAEYRDYVMAETLASDWAVGQDKALYSAERELGDEQWAIEFRKA